VRYLEPVNTVKDWSDVAGLGSYDNDKRDLDLLETG